MFIYNKFRLIWMYIKDIIDRFFYEYHHNGIFGPGGHSFREFKTENLALLISIFIALGFILYIVL